MDKLKHPKYQEHFNKIDFVENLDFQEVIQKYDSPTTFFYMDPPYWKTENYYSNHDFDSEDHERLAITLKNIKGRFALSYYEFKELYEWFPEETIGVGVNGQLLMFQPTQYKWARKTFKKTAAAKKDGTQNEGIELLIMNYEK